MQSSFSTLFQVAETLTMEAVLEASKALEITSIMTEFCDIHPQSCQTSFQHKSSFSDPKNGGRSGK